MNAKSLAGKVALITGGASGIGLGTAILFAREGAKVAILDIPDGDELRAVQDIARAAGNDDAAALFVACDVSDADQVRAAVERTIQEFARLDVVVANAGINGVWAPIDDLEPYEWDKTHAVNLKGTFLTMKYSIPHLRNSPAGQASIIVMSSVNGTRTFSNPGAAAYAASKAAQVALARQAALELARHNIRVNSICPGTIRTNIGQSTRERNTDRIPIQIEFPAGVPALHAGKGDPEDVARVCLFLAGDLSRHVNGTEIYVDGGLSLMR